MPSLADLRHPVARIGLLFVSVLVLLGHVCASPVVSLAGASGAPASDSHEGSHDDADGTHLDSCEAMTSKAMASPFVLGVGTPVIARHTPIVVVAASGRDQVRAGRSHIPLFLLHASLRT